MKRTRWAVMLLSGMLAVGLTDVAAAQVIRLGIDAAGPQTLDPHMAVAPQDRILMDMVFNGLLRYQPGNYPQIEPDLAETVPKPRMLDGKQTWTFVLRKGVRFHAGCAPELNADDVIYSLQRAADPVRSACAGQYAGMAFKRLDDTTIQVVVDKPLSSALFLPRFTLTAGAAILCRQAMEDGSDNRRPIGTGPFFLAGYEAGRKIVLSAHTDYFRGAPKLAGVEIVYLPGWKDRERGLKKGHLQIIAGGGSSPWVRKTAPGGQIKMDAFGPGETAYLFLDPSQAVLQKKQVRQALAHALLRKRFSEIYGSDLVEDALAPVPAFLPGGLTPSEVMDLGLAYITDVDLARSLLDEAGLPEGLTVRISMDRPAEERALFKGLRTRFKTIKAAVELIDNGRGSAQTGPDIQLLFVSMSGLATAEDVFARLFSSPAAPAGEVCVGVPASFSYPKIEALRTAARSETNAKKQTDLWRYAQLKVLEDMVVYPIGTVKQVYVRAAGVDYGHMLVRTAVPYPQITEQTRWVP